MSSTEHTTTAPPIWTAHVDSIWQWRLDLRLVRRIVGLRPASPRSGRDGEWHQFDRLLVQGDDGEWSDATSLPMGTPVAIDWDGTGRGITMPSTILLSSATPLWGRSFWVEQSGESGILIAAGQPVAATRNLTTAFMLAAMANRGFDSLQAAAAVAISANAELPIIAAVDDPAVEDPETIVWPVGDDGWARPWVEPGQAPAGAITVS